MARKSRKHPHIDLITKPCRDHITVGYHLEISFPKRHVRFVSVNDQFDTIDGITNQNKEK